MHFKMQIRHIIHNTDAVYVANHMMLDSDQTCLCYERYNMLIWEHGVEQNEASKNYENKQIRYQA